LTREEAVALVESETSKDEFFEKKHQQARRTAQLDELVEPTGVLPTIKALTPHERRRYSVKSLVESMSAGGKRQDMTLEREISAGIAKDLGTAPAHGGFFVPLRIQASGLDDRSNSAGGFMTPTKVSGDILDALRNHCRVLQLGARFISGIKYNLALPVENAVLAAQWVGQNPGLDVPASDPSLIQRTLSPKSLQATTSVSRQLLQQSSANIEQWLRDRLAKSHALALDLAAIHGSGSSFQPLGILGTSGISIVSLGTSGGAATLDSIIALESAVAGANADDQSCGFLTNSTQRAKLRKLAEVTSGTTPLWDDNSMLDYPALVSNQVSASLAKGASGNVLSAIVFGAWSALTIGEFQGAIEVVFDPFTQKKNGMCEIASYGIYDTLLTIPPAIAAIVDAT
jgi:HK97 family phage major capsid protein